MPNALPISRAVSFMAEATPCLDIGRELVRAVVAGVPARPMPSPKSRTPMRKNQYGRVDREPAQEVEARGA